MLKLLKISLIIFGLSLFLPILQTNVGATAISAKIIITEVKLGGGDDVVFADGTKSKDFVTIYNPSPETVSLDGWSLQYAKAGAGFADCNAQFAAGSSTALSGSLFPGAVSIPIKRSMNDATDGALRLVDNTAVVNDLVGWGTSTKCYDGLPATTPANGKSLQRYRDCHSGLPADTDDNSADFMLSDVPGPGILSGLLTTGCSPPAEDPKEDSTGGSGSGPLPGCVGIIISELLPNPAGADADHEFIELFNPTASSISLEGCKLQTTANSSVFTFSSESLSPGQYKAFYSGKTELTLVNSAGGSVFLIDNDDTEIYQADYAADLDEDVSWSLIGGDWKQTFSPTPDDENILLEQKPCPAGQIRNPDTNRCINIIASVGGLSPCAPGKVRNPLTNRCRNSSSLAAVLAACAPGQFRNPATNRCKKATVNSLVPCRLGQERNPDTNRCRKTIAATSGDGSINDVKDVLSASAAADKSGWLVAGVSIFGAALYSIWEWRHEILQQLGILRSKFSF